jgi:hypothetical protein
VIVKAQRFGSADTERKLQLVAHYLDRFVTALKNQPFKKLYVDAFAGTGSWIPADSATGINRQVTRGGQILEAGGRRIDAMLGTNSWRARLVTTETAPDLFGESETRMIKSGGVDAIAEIVIERLATAFKGGVVKYGLPLGYQGRPFYTLVFACANPSKRANELALRLARAVLKT